jgi:DNA polymerase-3 subunit epsilon
VFIHNAPFDLNFLNAELSESGLNTFESITVVDTLDIAKRKYPDERNNLDALCERLGVDNTERTFHGALLDASILAKVYLAMTSE